VFRPSSICGQSPVRPPRLPNLQSQTTNPQLLSAPSPMPLSVPLCLRGEFSARPFPPFPNRFPTVFHSPSHRIPPVYHRFHSIGRYSPARNKSQLNFATATTSNQKTKGN
jgi:hypothetical protein